MAALDHRETPEPAGSDPPEESISTRASACESAFVKGLGLLESNQEDRLYATALRKLQKRFTNWAGYLGVFAGGNGSLDQRLKRHPQHSDLVVVALNMLKDNLLQITAEPSDQGSDDSSDEETDRREIELEGIRMSINELDRLAILIRQSSTSSLDARVKAFASKRAAEVSSFETKAILAVNALYPKADESLRQHLSKSMVHRYTKLLYWQSHDRKLRADYRRPRHPRGLHIERTPSPSPLPLRAAPQHQTAKSESDTRPEPVARAGSAGISFLSDTFASNPVSRLSLLPKPMEPVKQRAGATTVLESGALFPKPPKFDDGDETASCPLCRRVFQRYDFTNDVWWKSHVNEDLVPFVCVATSCLESPNFTRRSEWRAHIEQDHGVVWQQNPGVPLHDENKAHSLDSQGASENATICPLCCSSPLEEPGQLRARKPPTSSESPEALQMGSKETSDGDLGKKTVRFDVPEQEGCLTGQSSPTALPAASRLETKPTKHTMMANHIAGHLQFLALLTPRLSTKSLTDEEDIDFASSQALSGDSNSGERSTLGGEFELKEGQNTQSFDMRESFSEMNPAPVPEESIAPQEEDVPLTEPTDWALFLPLDPPHEGDEDKVLKHIRRSLLKDAASRFTEADLPLEASEAAETLATLLRQGDPCTNFGGLVQFDKDLTRESLYQFFNTSLSSVDDGVYATLADHFTEEVLGVGSSDGLVSRRVLFGLLLKCRQPLDILRFIAEGLLDHDLPLSTETLKGLFPFWDDQVLDVFLDSYTTYETWGHLPRIPLVSQPSAASSSYSSLQVQGPYSPPQTSDGFSQEEIQSRQNDMGREVMQYPYATDLGVVKAQFEDSAGSLPRGVCSWIFDDARFRKFLADPQCQVLWIHGTTGRGKTMLLCGIIDELRETPDKVISFSLSRIIDNGIKSTTAVVRELIHHLVVERPWLLDYVRESYELSGETLSGNLSSSEDFFYVLQIILGHGSMSDTVLIIDDAHKCPTEVRTLLRLITHRLQIPLKWILSSRSGMDIMDVWEQGDFEEIDLNLAPDQISHAISAYANYRVGSLAARRHYGDSLRTDIYHYLVLNADGNFLWVSMACRDLEHTPPEDILESLSLLPPGLSSLYDSIYNGITSLIHGHKYRGLLATVAVAYDHQTVVELMTLVGYDLPDDYDIKKIITSEGGFFLSIRGETVSFIHKSARNYIYNKLGSSEIAFQHERIFRASLASLFKVLHRDMYGLDFQEQSYSPSRRPNPDPLAPVQYAAIYWINHFVEHSRLQRSISQDFTNVSTFLQTVGLYWLEAQILIQGSVNMPGLESLIELPARQSPFFNDLKDLAQDLIRLATVFKPAFQVSPMQLYASALVFSPIESPVMHYFKGDAPDWLPWHTIVNSYLDSSECTVLELSLDASLLATVSGDSVNLWDMSILEIISRFKVEGVSSFAFFHQRLLAFGTRAGKVSIRDIATGKMNLEILRNGGPGVASLAFSSDGDLLVLVTFTGTIEIWDLPSRTLRHCFQSTKRLTSRSLNNRIASLFMTDPEALSIGSLALVNMARAALKADHHVGFELSDDGDWITKDGKQVLWLPPEFQASCSAVAGNVVVISCQSGLSRFEFE